jgi:F0F1-type ATP synthase membrane subunit c/vacuolar-type H+-ATPase subunit K
MEIEAAKLIGAGLAVIGVAGAGVGIGIVFGAFVLAVGRNPAARNDIQAWTFVGFALSEATAIFALAIALIILFG